MKTEEKLHGSLMELFGNKEKPTEGKEKEKGDNPFGVKKGDKEGDEDKPAKKKAVDTSDEKDLDLKQDSITVNPDLKEAYARAFGGLAEAIASTSGAKAKVLTAIGASSKREKQWVKLGAGRMAIEAFSEGETQYIRVAFEKMPKEDMVELYRDLKTKVKAVAHDNQLPFIMAQPLVPDSVKGKVHVAMGKFNTGTSRFVIEISK